MDLTPPTAAALPLPNDCNYEIFKFLDLPSLKAMSAVNKDAHELAADRIVKLAKKYGYIGDDIEEGKQHLHLIHQELKILSKQKNNDANLTHC